MLFPTTVGPRYSLPRIPRSAVSRFNGGPPACLGSKCERFVEFYFRFFHSRNARDALDFLHPSEYSWNFCLVIFGKRYGICIGLFGRLFRFPKWRIRNLMICFYTIKELCFIFTERKRDYFPNNPIDSYSVRV